MWVSFRANEESLSDGRARVAWADAHAPTPQARCCTDAPSPAIVDIGSVMSQPTSPPKPTLSPAHLLPMVPYTIAIVVFMLEFAFWHLLKIWVPIAALLVGLMVANLIVVAVALVRKSRGEKLLPARMIRWMAWSGTPMVIAIDLLYAANCAFDSSPALSVPVPVVAMSITKSKSTHYNIELRLPDVPDAVSVETDADTYRQIEQMPESKRAALIDLRKGRLGLAWYSSITAPR